LMSISRYQLVQHPSLLLLRSFSPVVHKPKVQEALKKYAFLLSLDHQDIPFLLKLIELEVVNTSTSLVSIA